LTVDGDREMLKIAKSVNGKIGEKVVDIDLKQNILELNQS
jgi:hypothetical protein